MLSHYLDDRVKACPLSLQKSGFLWEQPSELSSVKRSRCGLGIPWLASASCYRLRELLKYCTVPYVQLNHQRRYRYNVARRTDAELHDARPRVTTINVLFSIPVTNEETVIILPLVISLLSV